MVAYSRGASCCQENLRKSCRYIASKGVFSFYYVFSRLSACVIFNINIGRMIFMKLKKDISKGSVTLMVLSVLEKNDLYGYQMIRYLEGLSYGVFQFNEGTLYPVLHALEKDGMVTSYWNAVEDSRMRKYYHITDKGLKQLCDSKKEWEEYVGAVNAVLIGGALNATI